MYNRLNCCSCISCFHLLCDGDIIVTIVDDAVDWRRKGCASVRHRNYLPPLMNTFLDIMGVFINFVVTKTVAS